MKEFKLHTHYKQKVIGLLTSLLEGHMTPWLVED